MTYALKLITPPAIEPVDLPEAKLQCRIEEDEAAYDDELNEFIATARQRIEEEKNLQLIDATWDLLLDRFPSQSRELWLPRAPLQSITHVKYYDADAVLQDFDSASYYVETDDRGPGRLALVPSAIWPTTEVRIGAVQIRLVAGFGAAGTDVPRPLIQAIKLMVEYWFGHHNEGGSAGDAIPLGAQSLINLFDPGDEFLCYGPEQ